MKRHFFITGASRGIGHALVMKLLEDVNNQVTGIARTSSISHPQYAHFNIDLEEVNSLSRNLEEVFQVDRGLDQICLVNNAGLLGEVGYFGEISNNELIDAYSVNTIAPAIFMNDFIKKFSEYQAKKVILNIGSGAGVLAYDGWGGYCSSKSAINMMSEVASKEQEIRSKGFKIFAVEPGVVDTNMQVTVRKADKSKFSRIQKFIDLKENKNLYTPEESAKRLCRILYNPEKFNDVVLDVRNF